MMEYNMLKGNNYFEYNYFQIISDIILLFYNKLKIFKYI